MAWCPRCGVEYREGFSRCSECDVPLSDQRPAAAPTPAEPKPDWAELARYRREPDGPEWSTVATFASLGDAELARGFLLDAGVAAEIVDKVTHVQPFDQVVAGDVLLDVPPHQVRLARTLLAQAEQGKLALPDDGAEETT